MLFIYWVSIHLFIVHLLIYYPFIYCLFIYLLHLCAIIVWCLFFSFLICLYKPESFCVLGRLLEAPPPTKIKVSLQIFFGAFKLVSWLSWRWRWPSYESSGPGVARYQTILLPLLAFRTFMSFVSAWWINKSICCPSICICIKWSYFYFVGWLYIIWHPWP